MRIPAYSVTLWIFPAYRLDSWQSVRKVLTTYTSSVVRLRSSHCFIHDVSHDAFSLTLTTPALDRSSLGLFKASPCRAALEGLPPSLLELRHLTDLLVCSVPRGTHCVEKLGYFVKSINFDKPSKCNSLFLLRCVSSETSKN